jgi:hypothetical protein
MLYQYRTPGVRFEWLDPPSQLGLRRTDIAGFVGFAARGPLHRPVKVESWTQFTSTFGGHIRQAYLAFAVEGFFANGGRTCWVVRVADPEQAQPASIHLRDNAGRLAVQVSASSPGAWGRDLLLTAASTSANRFTLIIRLLRDGQEQWRDLSLREKDDRYIASVLNDPVTGSRFVRVRPLEEAEWRVDSDMQVMEGQVTTGRMAGGWNGLASLRLEHFDGWGFVPDPNDPDGAPLAYDQPWGLAAFETVDEISVVAAPDIMPRPAEAPPRHKKPRSRCDEVDDPVAAQPLAEEDPEWPRLFDEQQISHLQNRLIAHCESLRDRMAILDPLLAHSESDVSLTEFINWRNQFETDYAALYYPWLAVLDPQQPPGNLTRVPPSGHVAGIYARGDLAVGVHKPPANEVIEGIQDVSITFDEAVYGQLNDRNINAITTYAGRGLRVGGARILSSKTAWRYVNVRRLVMMIEEVIGEDLAWAVFEPNDTLLQERVASVVRGFLDNLWRRGMLDGATAEDAFFVRCDAVTNPPEERDNGRLICLIGVQPPWPAEFVVVRIGRTEGGTEIVEASEVRHG